MTKLEEIADFLAEQSRLVIVSHVDPDADAFGSMCGLALSLKAAGKEVCCVNASGVSHRFENFPGASLVATELPAEGDWDGIVICDCGDLIRVGDDLVPLLQSSKIPLINIDHHYANSSFGSMNLVLGGISSTSEIVFLLLDQMRMTPPPDAATALLSGIYGDTGSFRYGNTSADTFRVAASLVDLGARPEEVAAGLYGNARLAAVRLQSHALKNLKLHFQARVSEVLVTNDLYEKFEATPQDTELLVEKARDIQGVEIAAFIRRHDDLWKVSLRSTDDQLDVSRVAESFGGGGHRAAAAFRWRKELEPLREQLLARLGELLEQESASC